MARKDSTLTVQITDVTRVGASVNGNPTYDLHTDQGTFRTMSDASCGYSATNYRPHHRNNYEPVPAVLTLTPAGRVRYITGDKG